MFTFRMVFEIYANPHTHILCKRLATYTNDKYCTNTMIYIFKVESITGSYYNKIDFNKVKLHCVCVHDCNHILQFSLHY